MNRYEQGLDYFMSMQQDEDLAQKQLTKLKENSPKLHKLMMEFAFNDIQESDLLDKKERNIITIALLTSLGATNQLKLHINMGRKNGLSDEQMEEIIIQTIPYTGFHRAWEAIKILKS